MNEKNSKPRKRIKRAEEKKRKKKREYKLSAKHKDALAPNKLKSQQEKTKALNKFVNVSYIFNVLWPWGSYALIYYKMKKMEKEKKNNFC